MRHLTLRRLFLAVLAIFLVLLLIFAKSFHLYARSWFNLQAWLNEDEWRENSLWLPDYQVVVEGKPIQGITDNLSGLTYDPDRRSLFAVAQEELFELSLEGEVLRKITLHNFGDTEAVEYVGPNTYVIADESGQRLIQIHLQDETRELRIEDCQQLSLDSPRGTNKGFEGLAYDALGKRLLVGKERDPMHIYEVRGFPTEASAATPLPVQVSGDLRLNDQLFSRDLSGLQYVPAYGNLLVLSEESLLVQEVTGAGQVISSLSLLRGMQGLQHNATQVEGIALDEQGTLYMVGEPNLFYVFKKTQLE